MTRRLLLVPTALLTLAALASEVGCDDSSNSSVAGASTGTSSSSSGDDNDKGSGGQVPIAPPYDPNQFDSGPPANEGAVCDGVPINVGVVDQENLKQSGAAHLTPTTGKPFQSFTVKTGGYLTGVELAVQRADVGTGDTPGRMRLEIYSLPDHKLMNSSELPLMNFPRAVPKTEDRRITLKAGPPGVGYFPFGSTCLKLTAGAKYYFKMSLVDVPDGVCTGGACTVGRLGDTCTKNTDCDADIWVSQGSGNPYDGGGWNDTNSGDLVFRTYMQP